MFLEITKAIGLNVEAKSTRMHDIINAGKFKVVSTGDKNETPLIAAACIIYTEEGDGTRTYFYDKETGNMLKGDMRGIDLPTHVILSKDIVKNVTTSLIAQHLSPVEFKDIKFIDKYHHFVPSTSEETFRLITHFKLEHTPELEAKLSERFGVLKINILELIKGLELSIVTEENRELLETLDLGLYNIINYDCFLFKTLALSKVTMDWIYTP